MANESKIKSHNINNTDLKNVHHSMIDGLGELANYFGFKKTMGQLYGTLLLSPVPLSLDDMKERLQISKASISVTIRTMEHLGMVHQVWMQSNRRKNYYKAETDYWEIIRILLNKREIREIEYAISIMDDNVKQLIEVKEYASSDKEVIGIYIERIEKLQELFRFVEFIITNVLSQVNDTDFSEEMSIKIKQKYNLP